MLRQPLLRLAGSDQVRDLITRLPAGRVLVSRYVPGERTEDAVLAGSELAGHGLLLSFDHLGEDTLDEARAEAAVTAYDELLDALSAVGLATGADLSVKLSSIGQALPEIGAKVSLENARRICRAARNAGATVTLDMEDHATTDQTLATLRELRKDYPETGAVLQAYLRRTEADCRALAHEGSRVRLCKGAYDEPESVAFTSRLEVDSSFVRCLKVLMAGHGHPMIATHDPRMIRIAGSLATRFDRAPGTYEFQMLYGVRPEEQRRLASTGERVRIYVPYGGEWYGYLTRRLAERPANLTFFLRSLISKN